MSDIAFGSLLGLTLVEVAGAEHLSEDVVLRTECGRSFRMSHYQDCCESVSVEQVDGDVEDLIGSPLLMAEEASNEAAGVSESGTWTFYKLATIKGSVTIRWLGTSNGYYSERVDFVELGVES